MFNWPVIICDRSVAFYGFKTCHSQETKNGTEKIWDCIQLHDSVAILIHHVERDTFVVVRQFRPPVYISKARRANSGVTPSSVPESSIPGEAGLTYELCAGIIDKDNVSPVEIAKVEIMEECGYDVPLENIETITKCRSGVGHCGTEQTIFYAQVTEAMKKSAGGGNAHEGEMIEVVEILVKDSFKFALDQSKEKPIGMMFALMWYHSVKSKT